MPIYEFYCADCHTVFNFYSKRVNVEKRPQCPKCGRSDLERQVSLFAISKGRTEKGDESMPDIDEAQMERAMAALAGEADGIDENDPRQAARLMRKLYDATGLNIGSGMEEMISRLEAGEDPDKVEEGMGDILEEEDPFAGKPKQGFIKDFRKRFLPPAVDEKLYEL